MKQEHPLDPIILPNLRDLKPPNSKPRTRRQLRSLPNAVEHSLISKLMNIDTRKLKVVLAACLLGALVVLGIALTIKLTPLVIAFLALLGLRTLLIHWKRN